ncbi:hypothetical protein [Devosia geojensis]|nr:hypothetical protein [Devosia geojensis]
MTTLYAEGVPHAEGDAGHSYGEAAMGAAIVETMDGFARRFAS